jgi:histone H2A
MQKRTGLLFPPTRFGRFLRKGNYAPNVSINAAIQMTAVIEYLVRELLEIAVNVTQKNQVKTITPRLIQEAMNLDQDFQRLANQNGIIAGGQPKTKRPKGPTMESQHPTQKATQAKTKK